MKIPTLPRSPAHRRASAALLTALAALTLAAPEARADEGLIWANAAFGLGGADFKGYPEFEYGFGLSLDGGAALLFDDIAFAAGLNTTWMRTSDASPTGRVVTTATFYGATVGAGIGSREGALLLRVGGGFAERDVDDLPDGEFNAVTRSSGFATLFGICGLLGDSEGAGLTLGVDYILQPGDEGMSFINVYFGFGLLVGD